MSRVKALLWDVDGTLAETERDGHRVAFNLAFEAMGLPWRWDEARYGELLAVSGGRERLLHDMQHRGDAPVLAGEREALAREVHARKNALYAELVGDARIALRPGVLALIEQGLARGVRMAIATTTSRSNLDALMRVHLGPRWAQAFAITVCGEDVRRKKPDPEVFLSALAGLELPALSTVAIEDSPGGVAAARAADVPVVVTRSAYFGASTIEGAIAIGPGLQTRRGWRPALAATDDPSTSVGMDDIEFWAEQMDQVSQYAATD